MPHSLCNIYFLITVYIFKPWILRQFFSVVSKIVSNINIFQGIVSKLKKFQYPSSIPYHFFYSFELLCEHWSESLLSSLDMRRDVQEIFRMTPHEKQVMMFSATLSKEIRPVCRKFMQDVNTPLHLHLPCHLHCSSPCCATPAWTAGNRVPVALRPPWIQIPSKKEVLFQAAPLVHGECGETRCCIIALTAVTGHCCASATACKHPALVKLTLT